MEDKKILDACCGSRMFWFDRKNEDTIFQDKRELSTTLCDGRKLVINPDFVGDFTNMIFSDESFHLIVFDPPHLVRVGENSWLDKKYGKLEQSWQEDIKSGFDECWRVLKTNGTLVFKWNEDQIKLSEILKLFHTKPIFGNQRAKTHWLVFFKGEG